MKGGATQHYSSKGAVMMQCFKVQVPERELLPELNATLSDS
jgi:hypothetical protein